MTNLKNFEADFHFSLFKNWITETIGSDFRFSDHSDYRENGVHKPYYQAESTMGDIWVQFYWATGVFHVQYGSATAYGEDLKEVYDRAVDQYTVDYYTTLGYTS